MTNEEKALELFPDTPTLECLCKGVRKKLTEMAEWKEREFKEYLENMFKRFDRYANDCIREDEDFSAALYIARADAIRMVINEFFKED